MKQLVKEIIKKTALYYGLSNWVVKNVSSERTR